MVQGRGKSEGIYIPVNNPWVFLTVKAIETLPCLNATPLQRVLLFLALSGAIQKFNFHWHCLDESLHLNVYIYFCFFPRVQSVSVFD